MNLEQADLFIDSFIDTTFYISITCDKGSLVLHFHVTETGSCLKRSFRGQDSITKTIRSCFFKHWIINNVSFVNSPAQTRPLTRCGLALRHLNADSNSTYLNLRYSKTLRKCKYLLYIFIRFQAFIAHFKEYLRYSGTDNSETIGIVTQIIT